MRELVNAQNTSLHQLVKISSEPKVPPDIAHDLEEKYLKTMEDLDDEMSSDVNIKEKIRFGHEIKCFREVRGIDHRFASDYSDEMRIRSHRNQD
jgi:hypothetical protein